MVVDEPEPEPEKKKSKKDTKSTKGKKSMIQEQEKHEGQEGQEGLRLRGATAAASHPLGNCAPLPPFSFLFLSSMIRTYINYLSQKKGIFTYKPTRVRKDPPT